MFYMYLIIIFNVILMVFSSIYYVWTFLIKFKASENGFLNVAAILTSTVSVIAAGNSALYGGNVNSAYSILRDTASYDAQYVEAIRNQLPYDLRTCLISLAIAVVFLGIYILLNKSISREIKENLESPKNRWNWKKISG